MRDLFDLSTPWPPIFVRLEATPQANASQRVLFHQFTLMNMTTTTMTQTPEPRIVTHRALSPHKNNDAIGNEKFPSFDDTRSSFQLNAPAVSESPSDISPGSGAFPNQDFKWPSRKMSQRLRDARPPGVYGHRSKKSVSEAINKFRTRQGSVSENAHELAEALKAPVSYKLIVSATIPLSASRNANANRGSASLGT